MFCYARLYGLAALATLIFFSFVIVHARRRPPLNIAAGSMLLLPVLQRHAAIRSQRCHYAGWYC
jgi:hypothetical protein